MHFTFFFFIRFASTIPLMDFFLNENPDLTLETSSADSDVPAVSTDLDLFFDAENTADFLLVDTDFCLSDDKDDSYLRAKSGYGIHVHHPASILR